jgi:queuine tRNA-ribosyltransferase
MFDCVMPTRNARNGMLIYKRMVLLIYVMKNGKMIYLRIEENGTTYVDTYSKAYLRHY